MSLIPDTPPAALAATEKAMPDAVDRIAITAAGLPMKPIEKPAPVSLGDINAAAAEAAEQQRLSALEGVVESTISERGQAILDAASKETGGEQQPVSQETAKAAAASPAPPKPTRRPPLPIVERLKVLEAIRSAPADKPDAELANAISMAMDRAISGQMVRTYRIHLGLASVPMPSRAELSARLAAAEAALQAQKQLPLDQPSV